MTDQPDHRPAPGTALGPPARVRAVVDDGLGDRVVLQGGGGVALQQLFAGADAPEPLLAAFANGMATLPGELGDMGDRLRERWNGLQQGARRVFRGNRDRNW